MRLLHTADWHLGQTFYEYDRTYEHKAFLDWLIATMQTHEVDALIMSGDVFDVSNPSAASVGLFYRFLSDATRLMPHLQVVITAGNHDSPSRLEAPKPLLEAMNIAIVGVVERTDTGDIDYNKLIVPLKDRNGQVAAWCMAIPFLRNGDYPTPPDATAPYAEGVTALYTAAYQHALTCSQPGQAIIAMGHLHTSGAEISEQDKSERLILGGVELIPGSAFHENIAYTALGHIHRPQKIGGRENVRYSGSPIPMSFSEVNYKHQVVLVDIENGQNVGQQILHIPVTVPLLRIPAHPGTLGDALTQLCMLPLAEGPMELAPYLEVRVLLDGPEPALRYKIEQAIDKRYVRLARIDVRYPNAAPEEKQHLTVDELNRLMPVDVFKKIYQSKYSAEVPAVLVQLFNEVSQEVSGKEA
jgi:exonuclease SbcD